MAQSGKNTSQQVISQALCLSGPICFHPHGSLPWGPHGFFPLCARSVTYSGTANASRWEQQLERLAGKINFLVAVAWGNENIPTGKAREEWKPGRRWQLYQEWNAQVKRRSSSFHEYLGCAETLRINPLWKHLCVCLFQSFTLLPSSQFLITGQWGILPALGTRASSTDVPGVGRVQPTQHTTGRAAPDWLCSLLK